jgi:predicted amidophosphoribosyltransferase
LAEVVDRERELMSADLVVPVPLHRVREKERGNNQAELLAKPLAKRLKPARQSALLMRTRPPGQTGTEPGCTREVRSWRFCHTSGQPS